MLRNAQLMVALLASGWLCACTPARMEVPASLRGRSRTLPVELSRMPGHERVRFGPWHTTEVDRKWTTRIGAGMKFAGIGISNEQADQPYTFTLARDSDERTWPVECVARKSAKEVTVGPVRLKKGTTRIRCLAADQARGHVVEIAVMMVGAGRVGGIRVGKEWFKVETAHRLVGGASLGTAAGYTIGRSYSMLAAVQTINHRRVWLRKPLEPGLEPVLAISLTSMLLYQEISIQTGRS